MSASRILSAGFAATLAGLSLVYGSSGRDASAAQRSAVQSPAAVDANRLSTADTQDASDWLSNGRTYTEQRFSPLTQISDKNVALLKPAWQFVLHTDRGQEGTPLVVDGVMYVSTAWSEVYALDATTGKKLWYYNPQVPKDWSLNSCCGPINRGVAVWNGKVYAGTLNGHLVALDAKTGKAVWDTFTFPTDAEYSDAGTPVPQYTMAGAPRVVKGKVIIGEGGGDKGVRGYLSAYDADTGKMIWRFYTVPGDPAKPYENPVLKKAAKSWNGDVGGGADVWDAITYDPDLDLLYFGTGNATKGGPHSPDADRLFGDSIVAIRPDTGEYVWHYQEVPDDVWDYDATPQITLADIKIDGRVRKALIHAPKDGFVYVLDRATGALISAKPLFKDVNWASAIDLKTGRPVENPVARNRIVDGEQFVALPGPLGGHSWQAMSYSPQTGLVYIPVMHMPSVFAITANIEKEFAQNLTAMPDWKHDDEVIARASSHYNAYLSAWDPATQREVWRVDHKGLWHGGTLATGGNLVFQGTSEGDLSAYQAETGKQLWSISTQTAIIAPPISYQVNGEQYIAVTVGWGGSLGLTKGPIGMENHVPNNLPRVLAFKLNGKYTLPAVPAPPKPALNPPADTAAPAQIASGRAAYSRCARCHGNWGMSAGDAPDLRYSASVYNRALLQAVVREGAFRARGMPMFGPEVTDPMLDDIRAYLIHQANEEAAREKAQGH